MAYEIEILLCLKLGILTEALSEGRNSQKTTETGRDPWFPFPLPDCPLYHMMRNKWMDLQKQDVIINGVSTGIGSLFFQVLCLSASHKKLRKKSWI